MIALSSYRPTWFQSVRVALIVLGGLRAWTTDAADASGSNTVAVAKKFHAALLPLFQRYYPQCSSTTKDNEVHISYNTRSFMIHEPLKTGEWQEARPEEGPKPGGVLCEIAIQRGKYQGAATVPQTFDKHYFKVLLLAPESQKHNCHAHIRLFFPANVSPKFLEEFRAIANDFEKIVEQVEP